MVPRRFIEEWKEFAPWPENAQVEQDLVIEKALVQLFSDPFLRERLAVRGGTALHKIFLKPQVRDCARIKYPTMLHLFAPLYVIKIVIIQGITPILMP